MTKKKNKHDFWKRVHFKYRISAVNENTLEEIWKLRASIFWGLFLVLIFTFIVITITSVIIIATPIRFYLPGYLDSEVRGEAIKAAIQIDSLEQQVQHQNNYIINLQNVFSGKMHVDSVKILDEFNISEDDPKIKKTSREADYVKKYEEEQRYNLSVVQPSDSQDGAIFFKPVKGIVLEKYQPSKGKYGIKISTPAQETVLATLEGTVIFNGFDMEWGNILQIQHKNGYISVYKKMTTLLKKAGDKVRTGEAIAIINNEEESDNAKKSVLYLELWYKGSPINPEECITF